MSFGHELRELIREAAKLAIRDEVPAILREQLSGSWISARSSQSTAISASRPRELHGTRA